MAMNMLAGGHDDEEKFAVFFNSEGLNTKNTTH
jgi:hypothetical protein